ncbi:Gamma-tubulin complex component 5 [Orchesella cincta]|uniref:Gamma-tubulin complex component n=1 Tax=Orchesella cincta TaxID=48709 RepID=A0A1D2N982_ORCCI|nr:Gamma-tubulin complex component 5 [Orchesella cincta]
MDVINSDPEILKREVQLHWTQERSKAKSFLKREIRKFDVVALSSQPVISNLLVLQSRFGEFWEWKKCSKQKSDNFVAFEEDVVREMLWQFIVCNPISSPVFTEDWHLKSNLMVATLSKSSFAVFVDKYGAVFQKLQQLRQFANSVEKSCFKESDGKMPLPSKIYRNYASGISDVLRYITKSVGKIERELMRTSRDISEKSEPACTTLLQLDEKMRSIVEIIEALYDVHSKSVPDSKESIQPWLASIQLISCLETHLLLQTSPRLYGVLLFLFSKSLYALLDDVLTALKTLQWDETYSLFIRDAVVRLNDSNFWTDCIKSREFQQQLKSKQITPLMCLDKLLPKILNILKTCEVLNQLEEDYTKILGKSNIVISDVIDEFLEESFLDFEKLPFDQKQSSSNSKNEVKIDYVKHFNYIGLGSSVVADCFRFLTSDDHRPVTAATGSMRRYKFEDYVKLSNIPIVAHTVILDKVLSKWFNPFCITAKANIQKIFQDYKVIESMSVFQEIILAVREDFAKAIIEIASDRNRSSEYKYEDNLNRNPRFQKLLNECYPDGRVFSVDLKLDPSSDMNCTFIVTPYFPLNLIVTPKSVAGYLFIGRQLHRIRKSLWDVSSLHIKDCKAVDGVDVTRMLMFRFCLINFCSSVRSFFTLKLFCKDFSEFAKSASYEDDLDAIRKIHQDYLESIETRMLRNPVIENIVIRKIVLMCELLRKRWSSGIPQQTMCMLEDTLKKCWQVVNDFKSTKYSFDFNELSCHFGPPPTCL